MKMKKKFETMVFDNFNQFVKKLGTFTYQHDFWSSELWIEMKLANIFAGKEADKKEMSNVPIPSVQEPFPGVKT